MEKSNITNSKGVISGRKLLDALGIRTKEKRTKSATTPLERITTQLPAGGLLAEKVKTLNELADQMRKYSKQCYYIYHILLSSGCRISEVLDIKAMDISVNGMIKIRGRKKGENRMIHPGVALNYIMNCKERGVAPFMGCNRKFVWSVFKKFGIQLEVGTSGKKVVTHSLRHLMIASAKEMGADNNTIGTFIGHKNKENTKRYGDIKK